MMMMNMGGSGSMSGSGGMGMMDMDMMNMGMSSGQSGMQMGGGMQGMQNMPYQGQMMGGYGYPGAANAHGSIHGGATNILGSGDLNSLLIGVFNLAINIFSILLIVALIVGVVVYLKRFLVSNSLLAVNPTSSCSCGQVLKAQWNCCPKCGQAKTVVVKDSEPQTV